MESKKAYITCLNKDTLGIHLIARLQLYIIDLLEPNYDILEINKLDKYDINQYTKIVIDGQALNPRTNGMNLTQIHTTLNCIKSKENYLILHDLHDWSLGYTTLTKSEAKAELYPILKETKAKKEMLQFFKEYNIKHLISFVDCPEYTFWKQYYNKIIHSFNLLYHINYTPIFNVDKDMNKTNDILFYGWDSNLVYPLRNKLLRICKSRFNVTHIPRKCIYNKDTCEHGLVNYIRKSWICIACTSNFDYLVRKYTEINAAGSVIVGNTNNQGQVMLGPNIIQVDSSMSNACILDKINYYLNNKTLLVYMNIKARQRLQRYTENNYITDLNNIVDNGVSINYPICKNEIVDYKLETQEIKKQDDTYQFSLEKDEYMLKIELEYKTSKAINVNDSILMIVNDIHYYYIDSTQAKEYTLEIEKVKNISLNSIQPSLMEYKECLYDKYILYGQFSENNGYVLQERLLECGYNVYIRLKGGTGIYKVFGIKKGKRDLLATCERSLQNFKLTEIGKSLFTIKNIDKYKLDLVAENI